MKSKCWRHIYSQNNDLMCFTIIWSCLKSSQLIENSGLNEIKFCKRCTVIPKRKLSRYDHFGVHVPDSTCATTQTFVSRLRVHAEAYGYSSSECAHDLMHIEYRARTNLIVFAISNEEHISQQPIIRYSFRINAQFVMKPLRAVTLQVRMQDLPRKKE